MPSWYRSCSSADPSQAPKPGGRAPGPGSAEPVACDGRRAALERWPRPGQSRARKTVGQPAGYDLAAGGAFAGLAQGDSPGSVVQGQVDDNLVDFGGKTPGQVGLPHCG
jgi:hypothetical protein